MTPEALVAKIEADVSTSLAQLNSGDADEASLRQHHPLARFRAPHPVFDLSCSLLSLGLTSGASGILLVPASDSVAVQLEVNGKMEKVATLPIELHQPIAARLKDAAGVDVAEQAASQAGSLPVHWQNKDFQTSISFVPSENGEQVAVRFAPN